MAHPHHCLVTEKLQSTYFNVLYAYFIIGRSHYRIEERKSSAATVYAPDQKWMIQQLPVLDSGPGHEILYTKCFSSRRPTTFGVFFLWLSLLCVVIGRFWCVIEPKIRHSCLACPFSIWAYFQVKYWGTCPLTAVVDACALWCHNHYFVRAYVRVYL